MENTCNNCGNTELTFVLFTMKNNAKRVRKQCLRCGCSDSHNHKHDLFKNYLEFPPYRPELREKFIQDKADQRYLRRDIGTKHYYNDVYLKSDEWKNKRENTLKRDNYTCVCCEEKATQVHHINYNNVYQEKEKQLISVCKSCHEGIHNFENVFFKGLMANFGVLGLCQNCNEYHENGNQFFCNNCKK
jgi:5-methylcytosine-specific restriction endonuclease McrA